MYNYTQLRMGKLVEEVSFRITNLRNEANVDYYTVANMANHAIYELMTKTLPYKDWAYITTMTVQDGMLLPREFLRAIRVILDSQGRKIEARYSTPLEIARATDSHLGVTFHKSYYIQPIYTMWGGRSDPPDLEQPMLYLYLYPENLTGIMDCYVAPQFNYDEDYQTPIPYEYEELVIVSTLWRVLQRLGIPDDIGLVYSSIQKEYQQQLSKLNEKRMTEAMNLDKFVFPVPPYQQVQPVEFNPPKR